MSMKKQRIRSLIRKHIPNDRVVFLKQRDFKKGTYRITRPGRYILKENIVFAPNPSNDFQPTSKQRAEGSKYHSKAYSLGFFAAITIEADGVEIDLNGKRLVQGDDAAYMQRFYANIETASSPFIPNQGPGDFGPSITTPKYIYIHNGTLGRSSHHAIHGNGNQFVWIENVDMVDYEFVGAALNGSKYVVFEHCRIRHNFQDLKVLATWSTALFARQFLREAQTYVVNHRLDLLTSEVYQHFDRCLTTLNDTIEITKKELMRNRTVSHPLFRNDTLVGDGNMYGLLSHPIGFAIHAFTDLGAKDEALAKHWWIENCSISDIRGNVDEVLTLKDSKGKDQIGPAGDVLKLKECVDETGRYKPNPISDAIFALASLKQVVPSLPVGTLHIDPSMVEWSQNKISFAQFHQRGFVLATNKDSMAHTNKGVLGIRLDGTQNIHLRNTTITDVVNIGRKGSEMGKTRYIGCLTTGIHLAYVKDVHMDHISIHNIVSENGVATGIQVINASDRVNVEKCSIDKVRAGMYDKRQEKWMTTAHDGKVEVYQATLVNPSCSASGILWESNCNVQVTDTEIHTIQGPQHYRKSVVRTI
jgi:hypothetical protein